jgi:hypothetical protein
MKEFLLLFRQPSFDHSQSTPEQMQAHFKRWQDWVGNIAAQGKLVGAPQRLTQEGKVLKAGGVITDGPFVEIRERLGGFIVIKSDTLDEAVTLAHGCPVLDASGSVEVRPAFVNS